MLFLGMTLYKSPLSVEEMANSSVMILDPESRSGGSGNIIQSNKTGSYILTNRHVCGVIENGGNVKTNDNNIYPVYEYFLYDKHDLCLIHITENLKVNLKIANKKIRYIDVSISGHPALLPHIVSRGNVSSDSMIDVMVSSAPCDTGDMDVSCVLFGRKPVIKHYTSTLISALIMPGSSGSAVFNNEGEYAR